MNDRRLAPRRLPALRWPIGTPRREEVIMAGSRLRILTACLAAIGLVPCARAAGPGTNPARLAARIDELLAARWAKAGVRPVGRSDDAEFLRRLHLDLTGKVPAVADVRRFLADRTRDKRRAEVERLLAGPGYVSHFAGNWRRLLAPDAENDPGRQGAVAGLESWLQKKFADNVGLDRIARELLTWPMDETRPGRVDPASPSPRLFYLGREDKPDELAAATTRLFLGLRLECAQCHNHPFARWTREQFWGQATFFTGLRRPERATRTLAIPGTPRTALARFLDGREVPGGSGDSRALLADWVTSPRNPYFARAAVNRLWDHFFGIGLVDPVDDLTDENKPSHPELLDELAGAFVAGGFDLKFIIRAILLSDAYQRTSVMAGPGEPPDPRLFSRMNVKALTPEQAFESLIQVTGYRGRDLPRLRGQFLGRLTRGENRLEGQASIPQVLALMNGELVNEALRPDGDNTLGAVAASPFLDSAGKVEALFLAALGRMPRAEERTRLRKYVDEGVAAGRGERALGDVFWALLNSAEFLHNH